jgi:adenine-specific DNA-methyltransferase
LPQVTEESSEAYKEGYKTISEISKERIRRVSKKIKAEYEKQVKKEKDSLFQDSNNSNSKIDIGFKVLKLQKSNFKVWDTKLEKEPDLIQQKLFEHIQHISPEAQQEAILYELLLKSGFELTTPIEALNIAGKAVFSIAEGQLLICLEKEITHDCIKAMAEKEPSRVICLDEAFTGTNADALKTNAVQIMKSKGVVNFRTV